MVSRITTLGSQIASISRLDEGTTTINTLSEQLASGLNSKALADYTPTEAKRLLNMNDQLITQENYLDNCSLVGARIDAYDTALTGLEDIASSGASLANTNTNYDEATNAATAAQFLGFLEEAEYFLNTEVGNRYIFAGSRFTSIPVSDLSTLAAVDPTSETIVSNPSLPTYDSDYVNAASTSTEAYTNDSISINSSQDLEYGICSTESAFQKLILGLRYAYDGTQDSANYASRIDTARTYLNEALSEIEALHSTLSSAGATLDTAKVKLETDIDYLSDQISDIQTVDTNEVSVRLTSMQTQMEASYSATSKVIGLSIINYL